MFLLEKTPEVVVLGGDFQLLTERKKEIVVGELTELAEFAAFGFVGDGKCKEEEGDQTEDNCIVMNFEFDEENQGEEGD